MGRGEWVVFLLCFHILLACISAPQALLFATSINQRIQDRNLGRIPIPETSTCTRVVDGRVAERRCAGCAVWQADTDSKLERCSGCMTVYYCGRECQRKDWPAHKLVCGK